MILFLCLTPPVLHAYKCAYSILLLALLTIKTSGATVVPFLNIWILYYASKLAGRNHCNNYYYHVVDEMLDTYCNRNSKNC